MREPERDPAVCVIVPAHGVAHLLAGALGSLVAQRFTDWEAIVVDDGDARVASAFEPFARDRRLRLLQTDNRGVSAARNRGVAAARAPCVAFLDGDDGYAPAYLQRMLARLGRDARLGFVSCDAVLFGGRDPPGQLYSERFPIAGPVTLERVLTREAHVHTAVTLRREAFLRAGGFDESLGCAEDLDLWLRLLAAGWEAAVVEEPLALYRRRPGSLSSDERGVLASCRQVYRKQAVALRERREGAVAERMLAACDEELRWRDGEDAVRRGEVAAGLELLRGRERRSRRWRVGLAVMRRAPFAAALLLRLRTRLPVPGGVKGGAPRRAHPTRARLTEDLDPSKGVAASRRGAKCVGVHPVNPTIPATSV